VSSGLTGAGHGGTAPEIAVTPAAADTGEGKGRLRTLLAPAGARREAVRHLVILAGYLAAGITVTWPRAAWLVQGKLPDYLDVTSYTWDLWWVAHQVSHFGSPFFTPDMAAPAGVRLGFDTLIVLPGVLMTPVTLAFGPSASLSLLTIVIPGLAGYAMYRVARLWLRSQAGALTAGACFGLCSMVGWQDWYHIQLSAGMVLLPVTLEAALRVRRAGDVKHRRRAAVALGIALGAEVLTNQEMAVMALVLAALTLVPWLARQPARIPARLAPLALGALAAAVVASPQLVAMAQQLAAGGAAVSPHLLARSDASYGTALNTLFQPSPRLASFGLPLFSSYSPVGEGMPGYGVVLTVLAVAGLAARWRHRGAWKLAGLWLGCSALALGVTLYIGNHEYIPLRSSWDGVPVSLLMPYAWLIRLPGLAAFRDAGRLALLGLAGAALLAGAAIDWLDDRAWWSPARRPPARESSAQGSPAQGPLARGPVSRGSLTGASASRGRIAAALIVVIAAAGVLEAGWPGSPGPGPMPTALPALDRPIAADHSGSVVLDIPYGLRGGLPLYGSRLANQALLIATADGHPRAISYTAFVPPPTIAAISRHPFYAQLVAVQNGAALAPRTGRKGRQVTAAQLAAARRDLRSLDTGWALVWPPASGTAPASAIESYLAATGFTFDYRADGVAVYRDPRSAG
jgi:hypothetical protein